MPIPLPNKPKVGKLRPTQVVTQHGPGAVVDLPELSVIVAGLDDWVNRPADRVSEPRLEAFIRASLYRPPVSGPGAFGGVPAFVFPQWLVCPKDKCRLLARLDQFQWVAPPAGEFRCPRTDLHGNAKQVAAFPARFMLACEKGHLDDFPWHEWAHGGDSGCVGPLKLVDFGRSGSANDLQVQCERCDDKKGLGDAFKSGAITECTARRPWLGPSNYDSPCDKQPRVILRGASNAYFPVVASALSIPPYSDPIHFDLVPYLDVLNQAETLEKLINGVAGGFYNVGDLFDRYSPEEVWDALHGEVDSSGLRPEEYRAFLDPPEPAQPPHEFEVRHLSRPPGAEASRLGIVAAATRLREVRALRGFTRIESGFDLGELADVAKLEVKVAPIASTVPWKPAVELRGEGIFVTIDEDALCTWEGLDAVRARSTDLERRFNLFQDERGLTDDERQPFPEMRYVLLHSLAHALIRELCLEAGYSSSALRERIYSNTGQDAMAGLLIYTASSDSEGSLGGLVDQAPPDRLGPVLLDALHSAELCAQDPLCGGGEIGGAAGINGAACHACLLLAETSCEAGNRFLDRATLVQTLGDHGRAFFRGP